MRLRQIATLISLSMLVAVAAYAANLNSSGRCPGSTSCNIGEATTTSVTLTTDGADLDLEGTAETLTLTATSTNTAVFTGADAAGAANTTYDTTGAGAVTIGSADVTSVTVTTDGGSITLDGTANAKVPVVSLASGALTVNTVHLATAGAADYDIPDGACDAAGDIGNWVTVVLEDASVVISITSDDASNIITVPGLGLDAGDELDSVSHTVTEGQSITLTCLTAENWYFTGGVTLHTDGTIAWADGGAAD